MAIKVSMNFERLLFDILNGDDKKVGALMKDLKVKGFFKLDKETVEIIKKDFCAKKINDKETLAIIKNVNIDPTAYQIDHKSKK